MKNKSEKLKSNTMIESVVTYVFLNKYTNPVVINPILKQLNISAIEARDFLVEVEKSGFLLLKGDYKSLGSGTAGVMHNLDTVNIKAKLDIKGRELISNIQEKVRNLPVNERLHKLLKFLSEQADENPGKQSFSDTEVNQQVFFEALQKGEVRFLFRKLQEEDDARVCISKDSWDVGFKSSTEEAYYSQKYLNVNVSNGKAITVMRDQYNINGTQAGSIGPNASSSSHQFQQENIQLPPNFDFTSVLREIEALKVALKEKAESEDEFEVLKEVALAEKAAKEENGSKVIQHLAKAGSWAFNTATNIGAKVLAELISTQLKQN